MPCFSNLKKSTPISSWTATVPSDWIAISLTKFGMTQPSSPCANARAGTFAASAVATTMSAPNFRMYVLYQKRSERSENFFPRQTGFSEVAVGRGRLVDGPAQVQAFNNGLRAEVKMFLDELIKRFSFFVNRMHH